MLDSGHLGVASYDNEIYLTFDTDWADDTVIRDTIELLDERGVAGTVFVTHVSPLLTGLPSHPRIEVGVHPNFNGLLEAGRHEHDAAAVLATLHDAYPSAVSVRSHSLFQSSGLYNLFTQRGLTFEVNQFIPAWSGIVCRPYREVTGALRVPYFWEDDVHVVALAQGLAVGWDVDALLNAAGLKVFDFHPIHVFLNTEHMDRYEHGREHLRDAARLVEHRYPGYGTRSFLIDLIDRGLERGLRFRTVSELQVS
jgi:peptidoglycan/xylan/chitin deacetylase (PgdA/CDA1 family)